MKRIYYKLPNEEEEIISYVPLFLSAYVANRNKKDSGAYSKIHSLLCWEYDIL